MPQRYYTVGEIERLIPDLERVFVDALQIRAGLRAQEQKLEQAGLRLTREVLEEDNPKDSFSLRHTKAMFRAYYETLGDTLARVGQLGGEVKDLELGLVDFPGKRGEADILLCWKFGEKSVAYWHPVDAGYSARRPIDDQVPREPPALD